MSNAVLEKLMAGSSEAEPSVEAHQVRLSVQDNSFSQVVLEDVAQKQGGGPSAARIGPGADPPNPDPLRFAQNPQVSNRSGGVVDPGVRGTRFGVSSIKFRIRAVLLNDEHVDSQTQQRIEGARVEFVEPPGTHIADPMRGVFSHLRHHNWCEFRRSFRS